MNVQELINSLQKLPPELPVRACNTEGDINCEVTGVSTCIYLQMEDTNAVELSFDYSTDYELDKNGFNPMDL